MTADGARNLGIVLSVIAAAWVLFDARRIDPKDQKIGGQSAVAWAVCTFFLLAIALPWYLVARHRFIRGRVAA